MEALLAAGLIGFVKKIVDAVRFATGKDYNKLLTQFVAWLSAVLATFALATTSLAESIMGFNLAAQGFLGQLLVGLLVGSTASLTSDVITAFKRPVVVVPVDVVPDDEITPDVPRA